MKIFEKYNFIVKDNIISQKDFCHLDFCKAENLDKSKLDEAVARAEKDLECDIPALTLSMYRAYNISGSTSAYGGPYCKRMDMAMNLALAKIRTGEDKYFNKMLDVVWAILDEPTWMLPEHTVHMPEDATVRMSVPAAVGEKYAHGIELGSAYKASLIAVIYHFFKNEFDKISPFINERILYTLRTRAIEPFCKYYFRWEGMSGNRVNNWCPWIVSNILLTTALAEDDNGVRETVVERSMAFLDNFISWYHPDGGCDEGPTYWNAAAASLFDSLELIEHMSGGKFKVYSEPLIKAMGEYEPRMNICGNYFVNFADSGSTASLDGNMLRRFGEKCGSEILISFGDSMLRSCSTYFSTRFLFRTLCSLSTPKRDVSKSVLLAATETYFPNLKVMVLRDSENPSQGMFFAMKGGNNDESHNHNDVGSFIIYRNGKPVLIDAGVGAYTKQTFSSERYKIWSMQSLYHNLPSFDGEGQPAGEKYASADEIYDPKDRSLTLELAGAYSDNSGIISFKRYGALKDGTVTVRDTVKLAEEKKVDFTFMTHKEPDVISDGVIAIAEDCLLKFDPSLSVNIEAFDPVGMNTLSAWGSEKLYRIHLYTRLTEDEFEFYITSK